MFSEIQRELYLSIGTVNGIVITPTKNPTAPKNAITKKILPIVTQARQAQATHIHS